MISIIFIVSIFILLFVFNVLYYILTSKTKKIKVMQKFLIKINGYDVRKIFDNDKIEYYIVEDLMISKKECDKLWNEIVEGNKYVIKFFGMNMPSINMHYKIMGINKKN